MSVVLERERQTAEADTRHRLYHVYPGYVHGNVPPPVGSRALCGHVRHARESDGSYRYPNDPDSCVVCVELRRAGR